MMDNRRLDEIPFWCEGDCDRQGFAFLEDSASETTGYKVNCSRCSYSTHYVWCEKCGMGGSFINNFYDGLDNWYCENCKIDRPVQINFDNPERIYFEEDEFYKKHHHELTPKERKQLMKDFYKESIKIFWYMPLIIILALIGWILFFIDILKLF